MTHSSLFRSPSAENQYLPPLRHDGEEPVKLRPRDRGYCERVRALCCLVFILAVLAAAIFCWGLFRAIVEDAYNLDVVIKTITTNGTAPLKNVTAHNSTAPSNATVLNTTTAFSIVGHTDTAFEVVQAAYSLVPPEPLLQVMRTCPILAESSSYVLSAVCAAVVALVRMMFACCGQIPKKALPPPRALREVDKHRTSLYSTECVLGMMETIGLMAFVSFAMLNLVAYEMKFWVLWQVPFPDIVTIAFFELLIWMGACKGVRHFIDALGSCLAAACMLWSLYLLLQRLEYPIGALVAYICIRAASVRSIILQQCARFTLHSHTRAHSCSSKARCLGSHTESDGRRVDQDRDGDAATQPLLARSTTNREGHSASAQGDVRGANQEHEGDEATDPPLICGACCPTPTSGTCPTVSAMVDLGNEFEPNACTFWQAWLVLLSGPGRSDATLARTFASFCCAVFALPVAVVWSDPVPSWCQAAMVSGASFAFMLSGLVAAFLLQRMVRMKARWTAILSMLVYPFLDLVVAYVLPSFHTDLQDEKRGTLLGLFLVGFGVWLSFVLIGLRFSSKRRYQPAHSAHALTDSGLSAVFPVTAPFQEFLEPHTPRFSHTVGPARARALPLRPSAGVDIGGDETSGVTIDGGDADADPGHGDGDGGGCTDAAGRGVRGLDTGAASNSAAPPRNVRAFPDVPGAAQRLLYVVIPFYHEKSEEMLESLRTMGQMTYWPHSTDSEITILVVMDDAFTNCNNGKRVLNSHTRRLFDQLRRVFGRNFMERLLQSGGMEQVKHDKGDMWVLTATTCYGAACEATLKSGRGCGEHPVKLKLLLKDTQIIHQRKRCSLVLAHASIMYDIDRRNDHASGSKRINAKDVFVLTLDGDTAVKPNDCLNLVNHLQDRPGMAAVCGRIVPRGRGWLRWVQEGSYFLSHAFMKSAERVRVQDL